MDWSEQQLFHHLEAFLTPGRRARLREAVALRTRHVALVLDDIYQPHNMSAALRSCDALGVQDVYLVEPRHEVRLSSDVAGGSDKWLTLHHYRTVDAAERCLADLRAAAYRVVVTTPDPAAPTPETLDLRQRLAVVIGNETTGVSTVFQQAADARLHLPMVGFVESYNLSVAAALVLFELTRRLRRSEVAWQLTPPETQRLLFEWTRASVPHVEAIEARWRAAREPERRSSRPGERSPRG
jgi:tRNA (guanosine-2'-O-)-methyltransferase